MNPDRAIRRIRELLPDLEHPRPTVRRRTVADLLAYEEDLSPSDAESVEIRALLIQELQKHVGHSEPTLEVRRSARAALKSLGAIPQEKDEQEKVATSLGHRDTAVVTETEGLAAAGLEESLDLTGPSWKAKLVRVLIQTVYRVHRSSTINPFHNDALIRAFTRASVALDHLEAEYLYDRGRAEETYSRYLMLEVASLALTVADVCAGGSTTAILFIESLLHEAGFQLVLGHGDVAENRLANVLQSKITLQLASTLCDYWVKKSDINTHFLKDAYLPEVDYNASLQRFVIRRDAAARELSRRLSDEVGKMQHAALSEQQSFAERLNTDLLLLGLAIRFTGTDKKAKLVVQHRPGSNFGQLKLQVDTPERLVVDIPEKLELVPDMGRSLSGSMWGERVRPAIPKANPYEPLPPAPQGPWEEVAAHTLKALKERLPVMPHETYEDAKRLTAWVNEELRRTGLVIKCPDTGKASSGRPSYLKAGTPGKSGKRSRLIIQNRNEEGKEEDAYTTRDLSQLLDILELMPADPSRKKLGRWSMHTFGQKAP